jgi:hypothetical protein
VAGRTHDRLTVITGRPGGEATGADRTYVCLTVIMRGERGRGVGAAKTPAYREGGGVIGPYGAYRAPVR